MKIGKNIAESVSLPTFRPQVRTQIGGATKNVIAIATGVVEGQMGDSARAARGFSEIRLAIAMGGKEKLLRGYQVWEIYYTCNSKTSRNYYFRY